MKGLLTLMLTKCRLNSSNYMKLNLLNEDQLILVNILDLQRKNMETTEAITEIVRKDL
jgi:hypothetical protein